MFALTATLISALGLLTPSVLGYDNSRNDNLVVYWGQNSYGATHSDQANWQKSLSTYCQDDTINAIPLAFVHVFSSTGGLPEINMANSCNAADNGVFPGTSLANCQFLASEIKGCQAKGKAIILSLGGATGGAVLGSDAAGEAFAQKIYDLFLGGSSSTRPFGDAVLDGVDLDIEGGSSTGLAAFSRKIKSLSSKTLLAAAPQCPFPDAYLGGVINAVGFDAIFIQFYNNYCSNPAYGTGNWNYGDWDNWARTVSPNKNVKLFIGGLASNTAGGSGYVEASQLSKIATETRSKYPGNFGGVMLWDASQAFANGRFDKTVKSALGGGGGGGGGTTTPPTTTTTTTTGGGGGGGCGGVAAWSSGIAYVGGQKVSYNGHLWTAKWWTQAEKPGTTDVWTDSGACFAKAEPTSASSKTEKVPEAKVTSTEKEERTVNSRFFRL